MMYAYFRRGDLEFEVDDWVYLIILPMKGVIWFVKKVKLSPEYLGPHKIFKHIGKVAYGLDFPHEFAPTQLVFPVSLL